MCMPQDPIFRSTFRSDPVLKATGMTDTVGKAVSRTGPMSNFAYRRSLVMIGSHDPAKKPSDVWTVPGQTRSYGLTINRGTQ